MHAAFDHLVRRGVEIHQNGEYQLPAWGMVILVLTGISFFTFDASVEYTFGRVIPTLVMVETPQAMLLESVPEDVDAPLLDSKTEASIEPELLLVKQTPITSTLRSTIKHLRAKAGCLSRFRGLSAFLAYTFAVRFISKSITAFGFIPITLAPIIASVICANLSITWTHIVISEPSTKKWFQRIPSLKAWKKVAGPTAFLATAKELTVLLPAYLASEYGLFDYEADKLSGLSGNEKHMLCLKALSVGALALLVSILFVFPANVILTRVQASLLAEEDESIVPFDRTFGGKVVPEILGGPGVVAARDAWRSFEKHGRLRLLKTYAKVLGIELFLGVGFALVFAGELIVILGNDINKFIPSDSNKLLD